MATLEGATIASTFKSLLKLSGNTDDLAAASGANAVQVVTGDGDATLLYLNTNKVGINTTTVSRMFEVKDTAPQLKLNQGSHFAEFEVDSSGDLNIVLGTSSRNIKFDDSDKLMFGTSSTDETIYGDGNDLILTSGRDIYITPAAGRSAIIGVNEKLQFGDATEYILGFNNDLQLYAGDDVYINATDDIILNADGQSIIFRDNAQNILTLNHDTGNTGDCKFINAGSQLIFTFDDSADSLLMNSDTKIEFGDSGTYIHQSANGVLDLVSDNEIELNATCIDINAGVLSLGTQTIDVQLNNAVDALNFDVNTLSIDALNERVGIGTAAPGYPLHILTTSTTVNALKVESADATDDEAGPIIDLYRNNDRNDNGLGGMITFTSLNDNADDIVYATITMEVDDESDGDERGRLRFSVMDGDTGSAAELQGIVICGSGGTKNRANLGIGVDYPAAGLQVSGDSSIQRHLFLYDSETSGVDANHTIQLNKFAETNIGVGNFIQFADGDAVIGNIAQTGATTLAYGGTSDYRMKTDLKSVSNGTSIINQLKIYDFAWKSTPLVREYGVLAHEADAVYSRAVIGIKDAVFEDGKVNPQCVDYSKFVPLLIQTVQELSAKVTALENA